MKRCAGWRQAFVKACFVLHQPRRHQINNNHICYDRVRQVSLVVLLFLLYFRGQDAPVHIFPATARKTLLARREHLIYCDELEPAFLLFARIRWTLSCSTSERKRASSSYERNILGKQRDAIRKRRVKYAERKSQYWQSYPFLT